MTDPKSQTPTTFVVLGVTGDLMTKKIAPALFNLHEKGLLPPHFRLVGVSRRDWSDDDLKRHIQAILEVKVKDASLTSMKSFLKAVVYHKVTFDVFSDYIALGDALRKIDDEHGTCSNKLFYLSVPPQFYDTIFENIHKARLTELCDATAGGWTRVVVEKPFGHDEKTAKALDERIARLFTDEQVYNIDHYLAKETLQNILTFRFLNNLFEDNWGRTLIEKIYVRELENIGAEDRGPFYESVGALRDVGQNHLLEMIALVTMDQPRDMSPDAIRAARAAVLETLRPLTPSEIAKKTFRAQYEGYRSIKGVDPKSDVETYFKVGLELAHPRWQGVPIYMEAGKRIIDSKRNEEVTEIEVVFKHEQPCLCGLYTVADEGRAAGTAPLHFTNSIIFRQDPHESITIRFWAKRPGIEMKMQERVFTVDLREGGHKSQYTEEYEKLLLDCIDGDQTLFVSSREIAAMWRFIDPIVKGWSKGLVPLRRYMPDSEAVVAEAATIVEPNEDPGREKNSTAGGRPPLRREIGVFGLGKMGANVARQLHEKGWRVVASNRSPAPVEGLQKEGIEGVFSHTDLVAQLKAPRVIWLMITAGKGNDDLLFGRDGIVQHLKKGDVVIDAANAFYEDTMRRAKLLKKRGIHFMDVGFSGGPAGARNGGSLMIGGERGMFQRLEPLFRDLSVPGGYSYFGTSGAGHFVKMVHNGIEYGMMQSLAEGFAIMKKSPFKLDLEQVAAVYDRGSVIESKLVGWLGEAYRLYGQDLKSVSGSVAYTGEGEWTVKTGKKLKVPVQVIEDSFKFRVKSKKSPSYIGKILSALRNRFGGHAVDQGEKYYRP